MLEMNLLILFNIIKNFITALRKTSKIEKQQIHVSNPEFIEKIKC